MIIIAMVTLLSRDQLAKYAHLEVCTGGESSDLHPRDYSGECRYIQQCCVSILSNMDTEMHRVRSGVSQL